MNEPQQPSEGFDLAAALAALQRRALLIIACVALAGLAAFALSRAQSKTYQASATLAFSENPLSQQIAGLPPTGNAVSALEQQASNVEIVKLGDTAARTAQLLGAGLTAQSVAADLSVSGQGESGVVTVTARAGSPTLAAAIANTYTRQFVSEQSALNRGYYTSALALVRRQLAALSPGQRVGQDGLALQDRVQTLTLLSELQYGNVTLAAQALPPSAPAAPRTARNVLIGMLLGLLLAIGVVFVLEQLDGRVKRPGDLAEIYGAPLLGGVPESAALAGAPENALVALPARESEAFALIRAQLRPTRQQRTPGIVLLTCAAAGEGASTLARELAAAGARVGSRMLLVRGDLREASDQEGAGAAGLSDVLAGAVCLREAIRHVQLPGPASSRHTLDLLDAGRVPANPVELLESGEMAELLGAVRASYDLVVIDCAPLGELSDAHALLAQVDGVIVVARLGRARGEAAERLAEILTRSGAAVLGVIANGAGRRAPAPRRRSAQPTATSSTSPAANPSTSSPAREELVST